MNILNVALVSRIGASNLLVQTVIDPKGVRILLPIQLEVDSGFSPVPTSRTVAGALKKILKTDKEIYFPSDLLEILHNKLLSIGGKEFFAASLPIYNQEGIPEITSLDESQTEPMLALMPLSKDAASKYGFPPELSIFTDFLNRKIGELIKQHQDGERLKMHMESTSNSSNW